MKILLVDDEREIRESTRGALENLGHEVVDLPRAREALELLERNGVDLLLTDVQMPGMDGVELLERVLATGTPAPALLAFSSAPPQARLIEMVEKGPVCFLRKPFALEELEQALALALEARPRKAPRRAVPPPERESEAFPRPAISPISAPGVSVPGVSVPGVSVPGVSVPGVATPPPSARPRRRLRLLPLLGSGVWQPVLAGLLLAVGITLWSFVPSAPSLPLRGEEVAYRGSQLEVFAPLGELTARPKELDWEGREAAHSYRVRLEAVDGEILWEERIPAPPAELPPDDQLPLHPAVVYHWQVEAFDAAGQPLASSEDVRFLVLPVAEGRKIHEVL